MNSLRLDLCVLADIRVGDVAAPCHAAGLEALADDGYRIGVIPIASDSIAGDPHQTDPAYHRLFADQKITRLSSDFDVDCTLALAFDSRIFLTRLTGLPHITASHRIVTVERPFALANASSVGLEQLRLAAEIALGGAVSWAPSTIICRDALASAVPSWPVTPEDWRPVAPPLETLPVYAAEKARPAVGMCRIARSRPGTWSDMTHDTAPMFASPLINWQIRGGPDAPRPSWPQNAPVQFWPDDSTTLPSFLNRIDIVANPDQADEDPCPSEALLAMRAGAIPYLPPEYRSTFGGAALYGHASELSQVAIEFHGDPGFASDLRASGQFALNSIFSGDAFVDKVSTLIGKPRSNAFAPEIHTQKHSTVLFYSSNGVGMGHLTRQLAIARRLPNHLRPVFTSHSQAVDIVHGFGFALEHLPYHAAYGEARAHWNAALAQALGAAIGFYKPSAVVYDGNVPFLGLLAALDQAPSVARVWIRRGMWGMDRDLEALRREAAFDLVVEPQEVAPALDDGPTARHRAQALCVPPIHILDRTEQFDRASACAALQLDPDAVNVLIAPGSGNNFDTNRIAKVALRHLSGRQGIGVTLAEWKIARETSSVSSGVTKLTEYPFSRMHNAFDFAIAAAGYNTFTEHVAAALPTIWTPNENAQQDRQILRANFASEMGLGRLVRVSEFYNLGAALDSMLDDKYRSSMRMRGEAFAKRTTATNGAESAARSIAELCGTFRSRAPEIGQTDALVS